ncbi:MAG: hypothetical protein KKD01_00915 [Proteobacteria bacterium]|nr:hypothetical protein [Pseudomonadota bacterium]MBU1418145.1 hypothetical protein [Pseudomonadota bacterium]MBU1453259.1 hypothetical protein [Pseudomonadota bacterium]
MKRLISCLTLLIILGVATPLLAKILGLYPIGNRGNGPAHDTEIVIADNSDATTEDENTSSKPTSGSDSGGPLQDKMSDSGGLFGDLYIIDRYEGTEIKNVPAVDGNGDPILVLGDWIDENGNPVINPDSGLPYQVYQQSWTTADAVGGEPKLTEGFARYTIDDDENGGYLTNPMTGDIYYPAPYPSQCVQPVADFERWGDISSKSGLPNNRIPIVMTYDATWERTECEIAPGVFITSGETWTDGNTYYKDIYWSDLVQEVEFGRLNVGRAPDAVHDRSFDEAINNINKADWIWIDAAGRMVLRTKIYDEFLTEADGTPILLETVEKAIDSPLENLALYLKLMLDGHLITPADDREPIDNSLNGGIPAWKALDLVDGPSNALRPTIDIKKMISFGLGHLVDAQGIGTYYTQTDEEGQLVVTDTPCDGCEEWYGIKTLSDDDECAAQDFEFTASFLAAAADKTGHMTVDKIVYFNSIMGINKVVGYSEYNEDGTPADGAINYRKNPVYFDYGPNLTEYARTYTYQNRGEVADWGGDGVPATYTGTTFVLAESATAGTWVETEIILNKMVFDNQDLSGNNIRGFRWMSEDDLRTIEYIHTYQIPGLR